MQLSANDVGLVRPFWLNMSYTPIAGASYRNITTQIGRVDLTLVATPASTGSPPAQSAEHDYNEPVPDDRDQTFGKHSLAGIKFLDAKPPCDATVANPGFTRDVATAPGLRLNKSCAFKTRLALAPRLQFVSTLYRPRRKGNGKPERSNHAILTARPKRPADRVQKKKTVKKYVRLTTAS